MITFFAKAGMIAAGAAGVIAVVGSVIAGIVLLVKKVKAHAGS